MIMKKLILVFIMVLLAVPTFAQHDEQVTVEGKYRPKANKVNKLRLTPENPQPTYEMPSTEIAPKDVKQKFPVDLEKIAPIGYVSKNDKIVTPTKNFLMAGIGTQLSPMFLYKHNSFLTKTMGVGVGVKHKSSWLNIKDYAPSNYMNNAFDVNLTTDYFDGVQADAGVSYKNDMYHYYGVNLAETPMTDEEIEQYCPRQTYNTIGAHLGLASTSTRLGDLIHSGGADYHYTFANTYAREHFVDLKYGLCYTRNWWGEKSHPQIIGVDCGFQYEYFESSHLDQAAMPIAIRNDLCLLKVNPFFEMNGEFYKIHIGVHFDGVNRIQQTDKFLTVHPDISGSLLVLNKKLEFYAGLNGGRKLLTYSDIIGENPFIGNELSLSAHNVKFGFEGGVRTNIAEIVDLHLGVRYNDVENQHYYILLPELIDNGSMLANRYGVRYYGGIQVVNVLADVRIKLRSSLTADLGFAYNHYDLNSTNDGAHAWYRPAAEGKLKLTYTLNDELAFYSSFLYQGGRYALVPKGDGRPHSFGRYLEEEKMKDVLDLSLGADYKVNDQITAFALIDNVLVQKYQLYYNYPVTGIQFFAGVKLKF